MLEAVALLPANRKFWTNNLKIFLTGRRGCGPDLWPAHSWAQIQRIRTLVPSNLVPPAPNEIAPLTAQQINNFTVPLKRTLVEIDPATNIDTYKGVKALANAADDLRLQSRNFHENKPPGTVVTSTPPPPGGPPEILKAGPAEANM